MSSESLKQKTITGMFWSFSDNILNYLTQFIFGIVLARLLSPSEFGLIGMITIFLTVSQSLIDSGFGQALIRKKNATNADFSTIFFFNLLTGLFLFILLFSLAPSIAGFYKEPALLSITRVMSFTLIISSFGLIQRTILTKSINFRLQTKITIISSVLSGIIAIFFAYSGFGVWSLVWRSLIHNFLQVLFLWIYNNWRPRIVFSKNSFLELFAFGSKLLASGLIDTLYKNIYLLIIGKFFSSQELGFYTRADNFNKFPSQVFTNTVQRVSYPVLSTVSNEPEKLKAGYKKVIKTTIFLTFFGMLGMAAVAKPLILVLIGEKWLPSVVYLQLLCFTGMFYPLHALNLNILKVKGRSDLFLNLEIVKKILAVPVIMLGIFTSIKIMIIGMIVHSLLSYFINSYYSGRLIKYPVGEQIKDIRLTLILAAITGVFMFAVGFVFDSNPVLLLFMQFMVGIVLTVTLAELSHLPGYIYIKDIIIEKGKSIF